MSSSAWLGLDTAPLPDRAPANAAPEAGVSWQVAGGAAVAVPVLC
jgi:hypothetical protein